MVLVVQYLFNAVHCVNTAELSWCSTVQAVCSWCCAVSADRAGATASVWGWYRGEGVLRASRPDSNQWRSCAHGKDRLRWPGDSVFNAPCCSADSEQTDGIFGRGLSDFLKTKFLPVVSISRTDVFSRLPEVRVWQDDVTGRAFALQCGRCRFGCGLLHSDTVSQTCCFYMCLCDTSEQLFIDEFAGDPGLDSFHHAVVHTMDCLPQDYCLSDYNLGRLWYSHICAEKGR